MATEDVKLTTINAQPTLAIRAKVPMAEIGARLGELLPKAFMTAQMKGAQMVGPPYVRYLDARLGEDGYQPMGEIIEIEAGVPVASRVEGEGDVQPYELPGGEAAVGWHIGPYERVGDTYAVLWQLVRAEGRSAGGPPWEVYWTDPGEEPDPAKWRTQVFQPIR